MPVRDITTWAVKLLAPHATTQGPARRMFDDNLGPLPVIEGDRLVGYLTDRDPVVRGFSPDTRIHDVTSDRVLYCFEDEEVEKVALNMAHNHLRRRPDLSREKRLVGIGPSGDLATKGSDASAEDAVEGVSMPTR